MCEDGRSFEFSRLSTQATRSEQDICSASEPAAALGHFTFWINPFAQENRSLLILTGLKDGRG